MYFRERKLTVTTRYTPLEEFPLKLSAKVKAVLAVRRCSCQLKIRKEYPIVASHCCRRYAAQSAKLRDASDVNKKETGLAQRDEFERGKNNKNRKIKAKRRLWAIKLVFFSKFTQRREFPFRFSRRRGSFFRFMNF